MGTTRPTDLLYHAFCIGVKLAFDQASAQQISKMLQSDLKSTPRPLATQDKAEKSLALLPKIYGLTPDLNSHGGQTEGFYPEF